MFPIGVERVITISTIKIIGFIAADHQIIAFVADEYVGKVIRCGDQPLVADAIGGTKKTTVAGPTIGNQHIVQKVFISGYVSR